MFEEGARLAEIHGCDKVFDFSIGNPNLEPPEEFQRVMEELVARPDSGTPRLHVQRRLSGDPGGGRGVPVAGPGRETGRRARGDDLRRRRRPQRDPQGHPRSGRRGHRVPALLRGVRFYVGQPRGRAQAGAQPPPTSTWTSTPSRRPSVPGPRPCSSTRPTTRRGGCIRRSR